MNNHYLSNPYYGFQNPRKMALRIPNSQHDFRIISTRVRIFNAKYFPHAKLDSETNTTFLLKEHGDHHFLIKA